MVLLEHTAGQGTSLGVTFEQLARIIERTGGHARVGVCLDTCHLLASGYDIVSPGVDLQLFQPRKKRRVIVSEWRPGERPLNRSVLRALEELPEWELVFLRTKPLTGQ